MKGPDGDIRECKGEYGFGGQIGAIMPEMLAQKNMKKLDINEQNKLKIIIIYLVVKILPEVEEQFQIIESSFGNLIEQVITLQRKIPDKPIL